MIDYTNNKSLTKKQKLLNSILIFILGISLGIFSKWLDSLALYNTIPWHRFIEYIDLGNIFSELPVWILLATIIAVFSKSPKVAALHVFLFFIGMNTSYHLYSIYICGFNPKSHMIIWYTITFISPFLASLCWYAKKDTKISMILRIFIFMVMMVFAFYIGWIYISLGRLVNIIFLAIMALVFWKGPKETSINLLYALVLRIIIGLIFYI